MPYETIRPDFQLVWVYFDQVIQSHQFLENKKKQWKQVTESFFGEFFSERHKIEICFYIFELKWFRKNVFTIIREPHIGSRIYRHALRGVLFCIGNLRNQICLEIKNFIICWLISIHVSKFQDSCFFSRTVCTIFEKLCIYSHEPGTHHFYVFEVSFPAFIFFWILLYVTIAPAEVSYAIVFFNFL